MKKSFIMLQLLINQKATAGLYNTIGDDIDENNQVENSGISNFLLKPDFPYLKEGKTDSVYIQMCEF